MATTFPQLYPCISYVRKHIPPKPVWLSVKYFFLKKAYSNAQELGRLLYRQPWFQSASLKTKKGIISKFIHSALISNNLSTTVGAWALYPGATDVLIHSRDQDERRGENFFPALPLSITPLYFPKGNKDMTLCCSFLRWLKDSQAPSLEIWYKDKILMNFTASTTTLRSQICRNDSV